MVTIEATIDISNWLRACRGVQRRASNLHPAMDDAGEVGEGLTKRNIEDGGGPITWPDLSEYTLIQRAMHPSGPESNARQVFSSRRSVGPATGRESRVLGYAGARALTKGARRVIESAKPLIWTRALLKSITHAVGTDYVDWGSSMVKSWTLFLGSRAGKKPVVPARNPFGRTAADNASITRVFLEYIRGGLRGLS